MFAPVYQIFFGIPNKIPGAKLAFAGFGIYLILDKVIGPIFVDPHAHGHHKFKPGQPLLRDYDPEDVPGHNHDHKK